MFDSQWPLVIADSASNWMPSVAASASLPLTGNTTGDLRQTLDSGDIYRWDGAAWVVWLEGSGGVVGPASSTDNAIARFDGTTGKLIENSAVRINDIGGVGIIYDPNTSNLLTLGNGFGLGNLAGNTQRGIFLAPVINSLATVAGRGAEIYMSTEPEASPYTIPVVSGIRFTVPGIGTNSTITRFSYIRTVNPATAGITNTASISDNDTYTGAYFVHNISTAPSVWGGQMQGPNGSAAAPTWSFSSSTGTGLYRSGTNTLALSTAGVARFAITSTGAVLIGTTGGSETHPVSGKFDITNSSGPHVRLIDPGAFGTNADPHMVFRDGTVDGGLVGFYNSVSNDLYLRNSTATGSLLLQTNATTVLEANSAGAITIGASASSENHLIRGASAQIRRDANATTFLQVRNDDLGAAAVSRFAVTSFLGDFNLRAFNAAGGATAAMAVDSAFTGGLDISIGGANAIRLSTNGTTALQIEGSQQVIIGAAGGGATHQINSAVGTVGTDVMTMTNGPAGSAGNPAVFLKLIINGSTYIIPAWNFS